MDGSLLERTEVIGYNTISIKWFSNGEKRLESRAVLLNKLYINRWNEDGSKGEKLFDLEKEILNSEDNWDLPLNYIIKRPPNHTGKQDVLYFMHVHTKNLSYN